MIPFDFITEWRGHAPWVLDAQVEQDLILSRALVEMFRDPDVARMLAFRGGTALYKLRIPAARYSEDIDLVQVGAGAIGPAFDAIRAVLDPWLGDPRRSLKQGTVTLLYRMQSEGPSPLPMRLKIEINSREHFDVLGIERVAFAVQSRWFTGSASIQTYRLEELLGTKLRALYQRRKGRDLFDLWTAHAHTQVDPAQVVRCFLHYLAQAELHVSRAEFEANLERKLRDERFVADIAPLLPPRSTWSIDRAAEYVRDVLLAQLPEDRANRGREEKS